MIGVRACAKWGFEKTVCTDGSVGHGQLAAGRLAAPPQAGVLRTAAPRRLHRASARTLCGYLFKWGFFFYNVLARCTRQWQAALALLARTTWGLVQAESLSVAMHLVTVAPAFCGLLWWQANKVSSTCSVYVRGSACVAGRLEPSPSVGATVAHVLLPKSVCTFLMLLTGLLRVDRGRESVRKRHCWVRSERMSASRSAPEGEHGAQRLGRGTPSRPVMCLGRTYRTRLTLIRRVPAAVRMMMLSQAAVCCRSLGARGHRLLRVGGCLNLSLKLVVCSTRLGVAAAAAQGRLQTTDIHTYKNWQWFSGGFFTRNEADGLTREQ